MQDRFTEVAYKIITRAVVLAGEAGAGQAGSQYILLSLAENALTKNKLSTVGVSVDNLGSVILTNFPPKKTRAGASGQKGLDEEAIEIVQKAFFHALHTSSQKVITTDALMLAIVRGTDSKAYKCLEALAVDISQLESLILASISSNGGQEVTDPLPDIDRDVENRDMAFAGAPVPGANSRASSKKTATLEQFAANLSQQAREGKLDPVVGRSTEIERTLQILTRRTKNNPILVGEPGVGKTAVVEGLAQVLLQDQDELPEHVRGRDIWSLDLGSVLAGTKYRGDFEQRLKKLVKEIQTANVILFIDEIHSLINAGGGEGAVNASNILKPMLARGELQTIGATTYDEYRKYFEKDAAMSRRFQLVDVKEPSVEEAIQILKGLRGEYEKHHNIVLPDETVEAAVRLSSRYIQDRFLPDKAIDLMDEAGAKAKISRLVTPPEVKELEIKLNEVAALKEKAIQNEDFLAAAGYRTEEENLKKAITEVSVKARSSREATVVTPDNIATVLSASTGIPVVLSTDDNRRFMSMEKEIGSRVIGQRPAITSIARSVRRQRAGLKDPNRPAGSFIFAGPTGVGKTELAKALAEFLFQDETALISLDMSEFSEKHTVSRLFGAPPGYVGHEEGGQLTERVRRRPYSVILFDEIEKAHPDIFNSLLQLLEEGRLTDGQGRVVDFKNTVVIMTTNVGARQLQSGTVGFQLGTAEQTYDVMKSKVLTELKREFKPEFLNRVDDIVVFPHLSKEELVQIVDLFTARLNKRLAETAKFAVEITPAAKEHITSVGYDQTLGARPLRRAMQNLVEDALSEMLLYGENTSDVVVVDYLNNELLFNGLTRKDLTEAESITI